MCLISMAADGSRMVKCNGALKFWNNIIHVDSLIEEFKLSERYFRYNLLRTVEQ